MDTLPPMLVMEGRKEKGEKKVLRDEERITLVHTRTHRGDQYLLGHYTYSESKSGEVVQRFVPTGRYLHPIRLHNM